MSKITFRADADLVDRLEELEGSKSEVMREALREYLDATEARSDDAVDADGGGRTASGTDARSSLDDALAARVDELVTARLDAEFGERSRGPGGSADRSHVFGALNAAEDRVPSVNLTVTVDGGGATVEGPTGAEQPRVPEADRAMTANERSGSEASPASETGAASDTESRSCAQCGGDVSDDHVFCPNCGEKATRRLFCECGDEVRSDWGFCPGCGRRTPAADVLDAP
ncbi:double zinc ribbon domain-containing protein [Halobaculum halobium]|uniref:Zinc ribbon domain-containing protein n=1 Tax=Halobaculum halobium TaxID=3032281 RepID=A0ABD5TFT0_9EURY|nr:zinc ribbon domain-containing protein [Halobaculum sp. SYNS20]